MSRMRLIEKEGHAVVREKARLSVVAEQSGRHWANPLSLYRKHPVQRLPVRHLLLRLVVRSGVADGGVQLRPLLRLVLGLEQVPHRPEAVGVAHDGTYSRNNACGIWPVKSIP